MNLNTKYVLSEQLVDTVKYNNINKFNAKKCI